jgi:hypothetical protein
MSFDFLLCRLRFFSALPLRPLRLCGLESRACQHRRDAKDAEEAQRRSSTN